MNEKEIPEIVKNFVAALANVGVRDMSGLEQRLLAQLDVFAKKVSNKSSHSVDSDNILEAYGIFVVSLIASIGQPAPNPEPDVDADIAVYRKAFVEGAHSFTAKGDGGFGRLHGRLTEVCKDQINKNRGDPVRMVKGIYTWIMLAISSGFEAEAPVMLARPGVESSLVKWRALMTWLAFPEISAASKGFLEGLAALDVDDIPGLEQRLLLQLAEVVPAVPSEGSPSADYTYAAKLFGVFTTCLIASIGQPAPSPQPELDDDIAAYRKAFVEGAHSFSAEGVEGLTRLFTRYVPVCEVTISKYRGDLRGLLWESCVWILLAVSSAVEGEAPVMWAWTGIRSSLAKWDPIIVFP
jgi:hypothetical protein